MKQKIAVQSIGLIFAAIIYIFCAIDVNFLSNGSVSLFDDTKTITIAHWQLEDGFREGFDEMIHSFETLYKHDFDEFRNTFKKRFSRDFIQCLTERAIQNCPKAEADRVAESVKHLRYIGLPYTTSRLVADAIINSEPNTSPLLPDYVAGTNSDALIRLAKYLYLEKVDSSDFISDIRQMCSETDRRLKWADGIIEYAKNNIPPQKVKIIQSTVPWRAYGQWILTQFIGNNPADIMELSGPDNMLYQSFYSLSPYIQSNNPYNKGTVLENFGWKDSFVDNLEGSFNLAYADYFGIGVYVHTQRLFVNLNLLEKATGKSNPPRTFGEWIEDCKSIKAYAQKVGQPILPIVIRGFDDQTLGTIFKNYFCEINGNLIDSATKIYDGNIDYALVLSLLKAEPAQRERLLAVFDVTRDIGRYFGDGFTAIDLEQAKYLFVSGKVGFLPEGTWNGYSLIKNSPFKVGVISLPSLSSGHKYSKYYTGQMTESGTTAGGQFGICKRTKNFELSLSFLQYMTSYELNQMTMASANMPSAVRDADARGILKLFSPKEAGIPSISIPFYTTLSARSGSKFFECLKQCILNRNIESPQNYFVESFFNYKDILIEEVEEQRQNVYRSYISLEKERMDLELQLDNADSSQKSSIEIQNRMMMENYAERIAMQLSTRKVDVLRAMDKNILTNMVKTK